MIAGRYSLDREIGRGGAGVVWLGRDEVLHRRVALKRIGLLPGADRTDLARAEREAQLTARLNHPHAVAVFDVAVEPNGEHWLVMEYVDGQTLAQLVQERGRLSPDEAAPLVRQAADALAAAHTAGIVHRDVKPSNILLDRSGTVKLTDFGIARVDDDPGITRTGTVVGSPSYLAPEIANGGRGTTASDVWSLGATVFHLLAGKPPYPMGDNVLGLLYRIVNEDPPYLDDAGRLAPLLDGTLRKDPDERWSMAQVRDFLAGSGTPGPLPPRQPTSHRRERGAGTQEIAPVPPTSAVPGPRRTTVKPWMVAAALAAALLVGLTTYAISRAGDDDPPTTSSSSQPTQQGIENFIRRYVAQVSNDPDKSWEMLTPKFQRESGGLERYREFWGPATNGRVLSIESNPDQLSVSYHVVFDNFDNGPGPTVLDLVFEDGRYLIDGERTEGFTPAG